MKPLETEFRKNGYHYKQITRNDKAAVYSQDDTWYEVIKIKVHGEREFAGRIIEAGESYPSAERWGTLGWTYGTLKDAMTKYEQISKEQDVSDTTKPNI
jgi:hypothetical protein